MRRAIDSVSRGLLLIAVGIILFLLNYGILSWGFWVNVVDLWPLILILAGIGLLFNRRIPFSMILLVFLLCMIGYSLIAGQKPLPWHMNIPFNTQATETKTLSVDLPSDVKKAKLNLKLGGAQVQLQDLNSESSEKKLLTGNYQGSINYGSGGPELTTQQSGDIVTFNLSTESFGRNSDKNTPNDLNLNLSTKVHYDLDITAGAINGMIDLSRLAVDNLNIGTGASKFQLQFGDNGASTIGKIDSGASELILVAPENVGLNIRVNGVAASTNFMGSGLLLENKNWISPNYTQAKTKIDLDISTAAGSIRLERPDQNIQ